MPHPTQWNATLKIEWQPILTFERRRLALLDWLEAGVDVVGVLEEPTEVGIAVNRPTQRMVVGRKGCEIQLSAFNDDMDELETTLSGVFEHMEPRGAHAALYSAAWSRSVPGRYEATRQAFASRASGPIEAEGIAVLDAACLADFTVGERELQVEYGIVSARELHERLRRSVGGMLGRQDSMPAKAPHRSRLEDVSLYADVRSAMGAPVDGPADVLQEFHGIVDAVGSLVEALAVANSIAQPDSDDTDKKPDDETTT